MPLDVAVPGQMEAVFERIARGVGRTRLRGPLDRLLAEGRAAGTRRRRAARRVPHDHGHLVLVVYPHGASGRAVDEAGGTLFTMTYYGSQMVVKNYNIMGVAKAALESAVRYMAAELGPKGIRVHAISPGPLATRAASGIPEFDELLDKAKTKRPPAALSASTTWGWRPRFWRMMPRGSSPARRSTLTADTTSSTEWPQTALWPPTLHWLPGSSGHRARWRAIEVSAGGCG